MSRKQLGKSLAVIALLLWFASLWLFLQYSSTRPHERVPEQGRIYEINNHSTYSYLTASENALLLALQVIPLLLFGAGYWLSQPRH